MPSKTAAATDAVTMDSDADDLSIPAAAARWRTWAEDMSRGGPRPPSRVVLEAALVLKIDDPSARLAADAAVIREVRELEGRAVGIRDQIAAARAEYGGIEGVRSRLRELRSEVTRLERLDGLHPRLWQMGQASGQASRIRAAHPHLFVTPAEPRSREDR